MLKWLLLGVDENDVICIIKLADYYYSQKDYNKVIKYYIIALENVNVDSNLINYYLNIFESDTYDPQRSLNNYFTDHFDIEQALRCKKYLNSENLITLNKYIQGFSTLNKLNYHNEQVDCSVCLEKGYKLFTIASVIK